MRKGSFPIKRIQPCQKCVKTSQQVFKDIPPLKIDSPAQELSIPRKRLSTSLPRRERKLPKMVEKDIFYDQTGSGKLEMISPLVAAVQQAKALISRRRRCRRKKACKQKGARAQTRKVYNRRRIRSGKSTVVKRRRKHGFK